MQINSVNSVNFKNNYFKDYQLDDEETGKTLKAAKALESMLPDKFVTEEDEDGNEVKRKSIIGTALSIAGAAILSFAICKKFLAKGQNALNEVLANEKVKKGLSAVKDFATENSSKLADKIKNNPKLSTALESVKTSKFAGFAEKTVNNIKGAVGKIGLKNVLAGVGGVAGAAYVSKTDSNEDGVADIAEKGVNAYKGAIEKMGIVGDAISALS